MLFSIRFLTILLVFSLSIGGISWVFFSAYSSVFYQTLGILFFGTAGAHIYTSKIKKQPPNRLVSFYMLVPLAKILIYGSYAFFAIRSDVEKAVPNMIFFLLVYGLFTVLEVYFLYYQTRHKKHK